MFHACIIAEGFFPYPVTDGNLLNFPPIHPAGQGKFPLFVLALVSLIGHIHTRFVFKIIAYLIVHS